MELPTDSTPAPAYLSDSDCGQSLTFREDKRAYSIPLKSLISLIPTKTEDLYILIFQDGSESGVTTSFITSPPAEIIRRYLIPKTPPSHLQNPVAVIISPHSGVGNAERYFSSILLPLLEFYSVEWAKYRVESPISMKAIVERLPESTSTVVILSGDTLIFEFLNHLPSAMRPTLVLIPTGTGNGLASSLFKPPRPDGLLIEGALRTILHGTSHPLPGFTATFSPGARLLGAPIPGGFLRGSIVTSWGFHASLVADANCPEMKTSGAEKFQIAAKKNLEPSLHAYRGDISIRRPQNPEWEVIQDTNNDGHFYFAMTGVSNFEPAFKISPATNGVDGVLRIIYFGIADVNGPEGVMGVMKAVYDGGKHVSVPGVRYEEVEGVKIRMAEAEERWRRICIDGAVVVLEENGWLEVRKDKGWADIVY